MARPRRRMFGPLFYSTLVVAVLVAIYDVVLNAPAWLEGFSREISASGAVGRSLMAAGGGMIGGGMMGGAGGPASPAAGGRLT